MSVMLYKKGSKLKTDSGMVDYCVVEESEVEARLKDGWFRTSTEACEDKPKPVPRRGRTKKADK